jgi:RND family efflux transporter MFP subunit
MTDGVRMRGFFAVVALIAVATAGSFLFFGGDPAGASASSELTTLRVDRQDIVQSAVAIGTVKSKVGAEVKVGSQLSGVVSRLYVNVGDVVEKGGLLAELDDAIWRARVRSMESALNAAESEARYALSDYERNRALRGSALSELQVEDAKRRYEVRAAAVENARSQLAEARVQLGYARITAPVSGTIASVSTYEGETVAASFSAPTFVTIVDLDNLEVQSYVDEADIGKVGVGQQVKVRIDSFAGQELDGVVDAIYPKAQLVNNVVNYIVIVGIVDKKGLTIRPEMTAHVDFVVGRADDALAVPRTALLREGSRRFVVVQDARGMRKVPVKTGLQTTQVVEIVSGLKEGQIVVADAQQWKKTHTEQGS